MRRVASALDRWICQLMCISVKSNILPLSLWLPNCHTQMAILTTLSKYRFIVHKKIYMMIICVCVCICAISSLLHTYFVTSTACTYIQISLSYLPIYIQSMCLAFIDNASTYSYSFNYWTNMDPSQQKLFRLLISTTPSFSYSLKHYGFCYHGLYFLLN